MTDKEIIEWLDPSVCWHEWETLEGSFLCKKCGHMCSLYENIPEPPTLTLEFMLGKLGAKTLMPSFCRVANNLHPDCNKISAEIFTKDNQFECADTTPTLALKGGRLMAKLANWQKDVDEMRELTEEEAIQLWKKKMKELNRKLKKKTPKETPDE